MNAIRNDFGSVSIRVAKCEMNYDTIVATKRTQSPMYIGQFDFISPIRNFRLIAFHMGYRKR